MEKIKWVCSALGASLGGFLGGMDGLIYALLILAALDYITGFARAAMARELSSYAGFKGILRKLMMFVMVGVACVADRQIIGAGEAIRTAVVLFYIANEGLSVIENAAELGLPVPSRLRIALKNTDKGETGNGESKRGNDN